MAKFFIERPIVAIVLSIIMVIVGVVSILRLPIAQYPNIVPPEIYINTTYVGADAQTVEQSVATPIEQEMSGVDNMNYMYSLNANNGELKLYVNFDVATDPNIDQVLAQIRKSQADSKIPQDVRNYGVTVKKSQSSPLMIVDLVSPKGTYDATFLANYAYINLNDQLTRIPGIASVTVFGAGQYAMRCWVKPDQLAKLNITVPEIVNAIQQQNTVNPAGQVGGEPAPKGQEFTYAIRAQGRLETAEQFGDIVLRANPDGSLVRLKDVARLELGSQTYAMAGRLNGKPSAVLGIYQLPGTNAIAAVDGVKKMLEEAKRSFPPDLEYAIALDTTLAVREGIKEVLKTLYEAMILVIIVVFIFLQGFRATLIPALAVPVSLIATFAFFPFLGFSINTIALMGMVLAIGLVVDDAIVVVEAVEHHIEKGLSPKEATRKAMEEVSGPVIAIALVLSAVFLPSVFIPGITGRLFSQFAVTIAISVMISAFNALTLSPALASMILKPKKHGGGGPLKKFYGWFNNAFGKATNGYVRVCGAAIRKMVISLLLIVIMGIGTGLIGSRVPGGFLPDEDQGYMFAGIQLPDSASLQRTEAAITQMEKIVMATPGVEYCTAVSGY
ncbi:MAG TPA: efflux RND transporter permease subunit, partial [Thermodesulfobacteriota bacterium]|nr:efflux RND transporter permease subunit [Thermodesulfobacteriota bacterium]